MYKRKHKLILTLDIIILTQYWRLFLWFLRWLLRPVPTRHNCSAFSTAKVACTKMYQNLLKVLISQHISIISFDCSSSGVTVPMKVKVCPQGTHLLSNHHINTHSPTSTNTQTRKKHEKNINRHTNIQPTRTTNKNTCTF